MEKLHNVYRFLKFCFRVAWLKVFDRRNPLDFLLILKEYMLSECTVYDKKARITYRTHEQNAQLLGKLIDAYRSTKSHVILKQILEVLEMTTIVGGKR